MGLLLYKFPYSFSRPSFSVLLKRHSCHHHTSPPRWLLWYKGTAAPGMSDGVFYYQRQQLLDFVRILLRVSCVALRLRLSWNVLDLSAASYYRFDSLSMPIAFPTEQQAPSLLFSAMIRIRLNLDGDFSQYQSSTTTSVRRGKICTYDVIKMRICTTRMMRGNLDSTGRTVTVAFAILFNALSTESVTAMRVDERINVSL